MKQKMAVATLFLCGILTPAVAPACSGGGSLFRSWMEQMFSVNVLFDVAMDNVSSSHLVTIGAGKVMAPMVSMGLETATFVSDPENFDDTVKGLRAFVQGGTTAGDRDAIEALAEGKEPEIAIRTVGGRLRALKASNDQARQKLIEQGHWPGRERR